MAIRKANIAKLVKRAFQVTGDIPIPITFVQVTLGAYDPVQGTRAAVTTNYTLTAINPKLTEQELTWFPADINTQKLLIAALDLPVIPKADDYVLIDGVRWEVRRVNRVPGDSLYILFIQEP